MRDEKGHFLKGFGFWSGKKRPNLLKTGAVKTMFSKGFTPWNKNNGGYSLLKTKGEKNYGWKGNHVGYFALHKWINRWLAKPESCEACGEAKNTEAANISGKYLRFFDDWQFLCRRCHMIQDGRIKGVVPV